MSPAVRGEVNSITLASKEKRRCATSVAHRHSTTRPPQKPARFCKEWSSRHRSPRADSDSMRLAVTRNPLREAPRAAGV